MNFKRYNIEQVAIPGVITVALISSLVGAVSTYGANYFLTGPATQAASLTALSTELASTKATQALKDAAQDTEISSQETSICNLNSNLRNIAAAVGATFVSDQSCK